MCMRAGRVLSPQMHNLSCPEYTDEFLGIVSFAHHRRALKIQSTTDLDAAELPTYKVLRMTFSQ